MDLARAKEKMNNIKERRRRGQNKELMTLRKELEEMKETVSRIQKGRTTAELQDEVVQYARRAWAAFDPQRAVSLLQTLVTQARKEGATQGLPSSSVHSYTTNHAVAEAVVEEGRAQRINVSVGPPRIEEGATLGLPSSSVHSHTTNHAVAEAVVEEGRD
ncbi:hypothetical protein Bbelb_350510 [Branchiostoma belcheri]|nr:hypothetical protein Bbelb_350510 [Branchiostoma belcheri]